MVDAVNAVDQFNKAVQRLAICACTNILFQELLLHVGVGIQRSFKRKLRCQRRRRVEEEHHDAGDTKRQLKQEQLLLIERSAQSDAATHLPMQPRSNGKGPGAANVVDVTQSHKLLPLAG